ncbi:paxillin-like [Anopheles marshallii]|uniref:paxillin-like n=1 Tax=Anopheles marshallii TaxID=1521116 RepID=UPI00237A1154|nr:paxillin-like [Anopheles marshallii]
MEEITYESVEENCQDFLDALLADLQNTVPGHNQQQHGGGGGGGGGSSVPGYGSLNGVRNKQQTSPIPQTYQNTSSKTVNETRATNGYNGSLPRSTTPHNSLPRSSTPQKLQTSASGNLSELDSLLQDLSSARYGNVVEKQPNNAIVTSPSPYAINDSIKRPSVDSLLEELSNAHSNPIYAVPHGNQNANQPGRQVTITVRETTTEKLTGTPSAQYQNQLYQQQLAQNESHTSSATKELDDLMASLSDFKFVNLSVKAAAEHNSPAASVLRSVGYRV